MDNCKKRKLNVVWLVLLLVLLIKPVEAKAYDNTRVALQGATYSGSGQEYFTDYDSVCAYLREQLKARNETVTISVSADLAASISSIYDVYFDAMEHYKGCGSNEGDALLNETGFGSTMVYNYGTYKTYVTTVTYYTNASQEAELCTAIKQAVSNLKLDGMSDYQKARLIYDYVCDHVDYDFEHLEDDTYLMKQTAYAAMIDGTSVCQGYAVLFYRMCIEAGVECRAILGWGNSTLHAWNIVKIGDYWYNVDSTWDGQDAATTHDWFLLNDEDFSAHTRKSAYSSAEFYTTYPMAEESWTDYSKTVTLPNYSNLSSVNYNTINGTVINNQANGKPKVLIFFRTTCPNSRNTIKSICENTPSGIDIIAIDLDTSSKETVAEFRDTYGNDNIDFVYSIDGYTYNSSQAFEYYRKFTSESTFVIPLTVYIDADNKVQYYTTSATSASGVIKNVATYCSGGINWEVKANEAMNVGDTYKAEIWLNNVKKNAQFFVWESSDISVAKIDACGNVTAVSSGTAIIKCKINDTVLAQTEITVKSSGVTGLQYVDGKWCYCVNGETDTTKTGLVQGADSVFWYVNKGVVDMSYTGFITNGAGTWYVVGGKVDTSFTGLGKDGDNWVAVFKGKVYPDFTGIIQNAGCFWYVKDGTLDTTYTGFYENENGKWYVANGKVDTSFKGLGQDGDKWLVVLGGKYSSTYTGLIKNGGAFWYVKNGVLDTTFTGITQTGGASWLVATGKLRDDYTGTYTDGTKTYTIVNGKVTE